jgi:hypothetical protein
VRPDRRIAIWSVLAAISIEATPKRFILVRYRQR